MARYHGKRRTNSGVWVLMAEPMCFFLFPFVFVSTVFSDGLSANSLESNHPHVMTLEPWLRQVDRLD